MNEKVFIKEEKSDTLKLILIAVIVAIVSSCSTYALFTYKNKDIKTADKNINYEIKEVSNPVIAIADKFKDSIVGIRIESMSTNVFGMLEDASSEASGIIYSNDGYIITNHHVIAEAINSSSATIYVTLSNKKEPIKATLVGSDSTTDLAVIKVDQKDLKAAEFGVSKDIKVGELAVAIGNPLGQEFAGSVTSGIVSAIDRKITTEGKTFNLIQTDAAINPGNSGGALVNGSGQVIGINTIKIGSTGVEGLGFAIPIDEAKPIIETLIKDKKIVRPYIGISGLTIDKEFAKKYELVEGVYVKSIEANSPAFKSQISKGDIITKIDNKDIKTMDELNEYKNTKKVGEKVKLKIYRDKKYIDIDLVLEEMN